MLYNKTNAYDHQILRGTETLSNKDIIDKNREEAENGTKKQTIRDICRKYKLLIIYCIVILTVYVIRYLVIPNL